MGMIAKAFDSARRPVALRDALRKITRLGGEAAYRQGHVQFMRFLEELRGNVVLELTVLRDGHPVGRLEPRFDGKLCTLDGILPGGYSVVLPTGRILWEGRLVSTDLIWGESAAGAPLRLAAASGVEDTTAAKSLDTIDCGVELFVSPGLESGHLGARINEHEPSN